VYATSELDSDEDDEDNFFNVPAAAIAWPSTQPSWPSTQPLFWVATEAEAEAGVGWHDGANGVLAGGAGAGGANGVWHYHYHYGASTTFSAVQASVIGDHDISHGGHGIGHGGDGSGVGDVWGEWRAGGRGREQDGFGTGFTATALAAFARRLPGCDLVEFSALQGHHWGMNFNDEAERAAGAVQG
jgi:hypothetical protein